MFLDPNIFHPIDFFHKQNIPQNVYFPGLKSKQSRSYDASTEPPPEPPSIPFAPVFRPQHAPAPTEVPAAFLCLPLVEIQPHFILYWFKMAEERRTAVIRQTVRRCVLRRRRGPLTGWKRSRLAEVAAESRGAPPDYSSGPKFSNILNQ